MNSGDKAESSQLTPDPEERQPLLQDSRPGQTLPAYLGDGNTQQVPKDPESMQGIAKSYGYSLSELCE